MKKMRFKKRAALALALAAVMTLGTVMPVWALTNDTHTTSDSESVENFSFDSGATTNDHSQTPDKTAQVDVYMNNPTSYTISVPKSITFESGEANQKNDTHKFVWKMTYDIPYSQQLDVSVANVDLKSRRVAREASSSATGFATRTLTATMLNEGNVARASIPSGAANTLRISRADTSVSGADASNGDAYAATDQEFICQLKNDDTIHAGNWWGILTFTAKITGTE